MSETHSSHPNPDLRLTAANGQLISAFNVQTRKINIDGFDYISSFISARVERPVLGIDFLKQHQMCLDFRQGFLLRSGVKTIFQQTSDRSHKVNLVQGPVQDILAILEQFLEVTDAKRAVTNKFHDVQCFIETKGPPIKSKPRPLTPEKMKIAKQYFQEMCEAVTPFWVV